MYKSQAELPPEENEANDAVAIKKLVHSNFKRIVLDQEEADVFIQL